MKNYFDFSGYDWNAWSTFLQDHWLVLVVALVVLLFIIRVVKTFVKWALVLVIVVGIVAYSGYTLDDVKSIGTQAIDSLKQEAVSAMAGEVDKATFTSNSDGTFTVKTENLEMTGVPGSGEVNVKFRGKSVGTMKIDSTIQALIDQAKANGKV
ncbi:hypothetical protein [Paenibacillus sp. JDR-2]|uniref:hypothetical protein n=1 Tax=Paenibacillus sp. (strain JDR-2) TaxID=324057 RepID=UPI000166B2B5|nr:hypothetical protein [Paenibacillus sp. JDR-2]ACT03483.1 hypothetical protein Pjdr2_4871 [Paenibacillus sp. JDR-2]